MQYEGFILIVIQMNQLLKDFGGGEEMKWYRN